MELKLNDLTLNTQLGKYPQPAYGVWAAFTIRL